jgi:predicted nucleic acid-binding protein
MARGAGPLTRIFAFWDASALVPLCVVQGSTPSVVRLYKSYPAVVWWATPVEIASALALLVRTREISSGDCAKARQVAAALAEEWSVVQPSNALCARATQLVERYDLRAADAMQLAAALGWCENVPRGEIFLTADQKLREAAVRSGFDGKQI